MNDVVPADSAARVGIAGHYKSVHPQISCRAPGHSACPCQAEDDGLTPDDARDCLLASVPRCRDYEVLSLEQCLGRVLARDVFSRFDLDPPVGMGLDCHVRNVCDLHQLCNADGMCSRQRVRVGSLVLRAARRLRPQDLGAATSAGHDVLEVVRLPRVALLKPDDISSGRGAHPQSCSSRVGHRSSLVAMLDALDCHVACASISGADNAHLVESLCAAAASSDLVISTCASPGHEECVKRAVRKVGRLDQSQVRLQPGSSVSFGRIGITPFIGLPGHPSSAMVTFLLFAAPAIRRLQGRKDLFPAPFLLPTAFRHSAGRHEDYLFVNVRRSHLYPAHPQGVVHSLSAARADGLARVAPGKRVLIAEFLEYFSYESLLA